MKAVTHAIAGWALIPAMALFLGGGWFVVLLLLFLVNRDPVFFNMWIWSPAFLFAGWFLGMLLRRMFFGHVIAAECPVCGGQLAIEFKNPWIYRCNACELVWDGKTDPLRDRQATSDQ